MLNPLDVFKGLVDKLSLSSHFSFNKEDNSKKEENKVSLVAKKGGVINLTCNINVSTPQGHVNLADAPDFTPDQQKKLVDSAKALLSDGFLMRTSDSNEKLEIVRDYELNHDDLLDFVIKSIPSKDKIIWQSALIIRKQHELGNKERVVALRNDLQNHSSRAINISNLCTAGYLEEQIIPLYDYFVGKMNNPKKFEEIYSVIVEEYPFAVFVSHYKTSKKISDSIKRKIETVKKGGWKTVNIHAIGNDNVKKAELVLKQISSECASDIKDIVTESSDKSHFRKTIILNV